MLYVLHDMSMVCNCFTVKVFVSNFKVEKVKTWTKLYVFLRFFDMTLQKNVKSRVFWDFPKKRKKTYSRTMINKRCFSKEFHFELVYRSTYEYT